MLAKLTRGNQVTIPKELVKKAKLKEGNDYLDVVFTRGFIILKPVDVVERVPPKEYRKAIKEMAAARKR